MDTEKKSLREMAYSSIKESIITCKYPPRMVLSEEILQNDLGVSRTPIRDALGRLEHEGLIVIMPKKGIYVMPLSISDVDSFYEVRKLIEPYIIRTHGKDIDKDKLISLQQRHLAMLTNYQMEGDSPEFQKMVHDLDDELHHIIATATTNKYFREMYDKVFSHNARFGYLVGKQAPNRTYDTILEHLSIIQFLLKEDWDSAASKLIAHLDVSHEASMLLIENSDMV